MVLSSESRNLDRNELGCTKDVEISTDLVAGSGSYGNMFDIRTASSSILIESIEFYTDRTKDVNFHVFTKSGTHRGSEKCEECWVKISEGTAKGRGELATTPIPKELFTPVHVNSHETQSFVIVLDTPDIRYGIGLGEDEEVDSSNEHISIYSGVSVSQYPAFHPRGTYFSPRLWKGVIHYSTSIKCTETPSIFPSTLPSKQPSLSPSIIPTFHSSSFPSTFPSPVPSLHYSTVPSIFSSRGPSTGPSNYPTRERTLTDVIYSFTLEHEPMDMRFFLSDINGIVADFLTKVIDIHHVEGGSDTLFELVSNGNLKLEDVVTDTFKSDTDSQCRPSSIEKLCTGVQNTATFIHTDDITSAQVKYAFHLYARDIISQLSQYSNIIYTGPQTVSTDKSLKIDGVGLQAFTEDSSSSYFEKSVLDFLVYTLNEKATIADVKIKEYKIINHSRNRQLETNIVETQPVNSTLVTASDPDNSDNNREREHLSLSVNVTLTVTGEYQAPPVVDLSEIVSDSFDNEGEVLVESLRAGGNEEFERVTSIEVQSFVKEKNFEIPEQRPDDRIPQEEMQVINVWTRPMSMIIYGTSIFVLLFSALLIMWSRKRKICCYRSDDESFFTEGEFSDLGFLNLKFNSKGDGLDFHGSSRSNKSSNRSSRFF